MPDSHASAIQSVPLNLKELAEILGKAHQTVLAAIPNDNQQARHPAATTEKDAETRAYILPRFIVEEEKRLLALYGASNWKDMFNKAYEQLYSIATLMRNFDTEAKIDAHFIRQMAESLLLPISLLNRLCALIADFEPAGGCPHAEM